MVANTWTLGARDARTCWRRWASSSERKSSRRMTGHSPDSAWSRGNLGELEGEGCQPLFAARAEGSQRVVAAQEGKIVTMGAHYRDRLCALAGRLLLEGGGKRCLNLCQPGLR